VIIGTLELEIRIQGSHSLKDKRRILRSLIDRCRRELCVSIAEVEDHDLWNRAVVGVACVSNVASHAEAILQAVIDKADGAPDLEVIGAIKTIART
jgi:uncharacterized protein